ncbi:hypothetical protein ACFYVR_09865 [Rhodococcus sp. NPDC003318]|uniref:hypothetical protein n=1 Tax=Rhodococcus sp. NPDC003318 TaxID=3364503 RepID=UPI0036C14550
MSATTPSEATPSARTRSGRTLRRVAVTGALVGLPLMAVTGTAMADTVDHGGPGRNQDWQNDQHPQNDQNRGQNRGQGQDHNQDWQNWWNQAVHDPGHIPPLPQAPLPQLPQQPAVIFGS